MLSTLRELGMLSARYAEQEGLISKQSLANTMAASVAFPVPVPIAIASADSGAKISAIVSAPIPASATVQNPPAKAFSPALSSSVSSVSLPNSPIMSHSPPSSNADCSVPAVVPLVAQRPAFAQGNKYQQLGLSFMPVSSAFNSAIATPQGILLQTPMGLTPLSAVPATLLTTAPQYVQASRVEPASSVQSARLRKPFHKRRPAHMDKSMLICHFCGRRETPEWRKGPGGPATLCNACGLQWAKKIRAQRHASSSSSSTPATATPNSAEPTTIKEPKETKETTVSEPAKAEAVEAK